MLENRIFIIDLCHAIAFVITSVFFNMTKFLIEQIDYYN